MRQALGDHAVAGDGDIAGVDAGLAQGMHDRAQQHAIAAQRAQRQTQPALHHARREIGLIEEEVVDHEHGREGQHPVGGDLEQFVGDALTPPGTIDVVQLGEEMEDQQGQEDDDPMLGTHAGFRRPGACHIGAQRDHGEVEQAVCERDCRGIRMQNAAFFQIHGSILVRIPCTNFQLGEAATSV